MDNYTVQKYFEELKLNKIYYKPNPGNGGDALIASATFQFFDSLEIPIKTIKEGDDLTGKTVIYAGGGNLISKYTNASDFIREWHIKVEKLIVLPHTIEGHEELLKELGTNVTLFCREQRSYDYVKQICEGPKIFLDHDMATFFNVSQNLKNRSKRSLYNQIILKKVKTGYFSFKNLHAFREDVEATQIQIPADNFDISKIINYDWKMQEREVVDRTTLEILALLDKFDVVHTNRLHICVAANLLKKKVFFYPNNYYKNQEVYKFSLKSSSNIHFIES